MRAIVALVALSPLALALAGCDFDSNADQPPIRPVLSMVVKATNQGGQVFAGVVDAQVKSDLGFQTLGRLIAREVEVGDLVKEGQVLARLDPKALEFAVRNSEAMLASRRAELVNAISTVERQTSLREGGVTTESSLEQAQQQRDSALASVAKAQTDLTKAREQLSYTTLKARFDGVVTAAGVDVGQVVSSGQTVVTVARPDQRDAVIDVPDWIKFTDIDVGSSVEVALQIRPSLTVVGKVREITPQSDAATRSRRVKVALIDPPEVFRLGTTVRVTVQDRGSADPGIFLPASAILTENGKTSVWVVDAKAATVRKRAIELVPATADAATVQVRSGIAAGERIVTAGVHSLTDGQKIKVGEIVE